MRLTLELLQWAVIVFLGVMVFGLARQLGAFLVPHREQLAQQGPQAGQRLTRPLIDEPDLLALRAAMDRREADRAVLVVVDQNCSGCRDLIDDIETLSRGGRLLPIAAVVKGAGVTFLQQARELFDVVIEDGDGSRTRSADLIVTPHALVVDRDMRVDRIEAAAAIAPLVQTWFAAPDAELNGLAVIASATGGPTSNARIEATDD